MGEGSRRGKEKKRKKAEKGKENLSVSLGPGKSLPQASTTTLILTTVGGHFPGACSVLGPGGLPIPYSTCKPDRAHL